jgi:hypothetical protein
MEDPELIPDLKTAQTEHDPLHGQWLLPPDARGLVLLVRIGINAEFSLSTEPNTGEEVLAAVLQSAGLASLTIDLLTQKESRFIGVSNNVPLHTKRLLDALMRVKQHLQNEGLMTLPIGLCGSGPSSPVVVRVAALRDNDIAAVVCRGGLIDRAGSLYLHSLVAPILLLVGEEDKTLIASSQRALQEISCRKALKLVAGSDSDFASTSALAVMADEAAQWFAQQFPLAQEK